MANISKAAAAELSSECVPCIASQGDKFDGNACRICQRGLLRLLPDSQERKDVQFIGLFTKRQAKQSGNGRVIA